jgi:elongation factor G
MRRYNVPRLAFVNKLDRAGSNPARVVAQMREKLGHNAVLMQLPIGLEDRFEGVIDLVNMEAVYFEGANGSEVVRKPIPGALQADAEAAREQMLDAVSMFSEELMEAILEERATPEQIHDAVRSGVLSLDLTPVFLGSAYKNKGVQLLLDGVTRYLPGPGDVRNTGVDLDKDEEEVEVSSDREQPLIALAFKLDDGRYGQLTYVRVYRGTLSRGDTIINARTGKKVKVGRLVRMHADKMEDIEATGAGDIVALFGIDCASGDTFTAPGVSIAMTSMHIPKPVISLSVKPVDNRDSDKLAKALARFVREDPTFKSSVDPESGETVIAGMGELHLDVYVERMKREYGCAVQTGAPQVAYRECISARSDFNYTHRKQTGGAGQYAKVGGYIEPLPGGDGFEFVDEVRGGSVPTEYISACEKGFASACEKGSLIEAPVLGVRVVLNDGAAHAVDSSDLAFQLASRSAFREAYARAKPVVLEPIMRVEIEGPSEFQGAYIKAIMQRRGLVVGSMDADGFTRVEAQVPLAAMFGFATDLRSASQGKAEFTMEFAKYAPVPPNVQEELVEAAAQNRGRK